MDFTVFLIIAGLVVGIIMSICDKTPIWAWVCGTISVCAAGLWTIIATIIGMAIPANEVVQTQTIPIQVIVQEENQSYFIGSDNNSYYWYLERDENNEKTLHKVAINKYVNIYNNEKENPYVVITDKDSSNIFIRFFFFTEKQYTDIYIPTDGIDYKYHVIK